MKSPLAAFALCLTATLAACGDAPADPPEDSADGADSDVETPPADPFTDIEAAPDEAAPSADPWAGRYYSQDKVEGWLREHYADAGPILYASGEYNLNGVGSPEVLLYVGGPMLCGSGGCNVVVLEETESGLNEVGDISVSQMPVGVLDTKTNGWFDLAVTTYGGGAPEKVMKLPFGGLRYPGNPTVAPATEVPEIGTVVIAEQELAPLSGTR